jgi:hypothetical protein
MKTKCFCQGAHGGAITALTLRLAGATPQRVQICTHHLKTLAETALSIVVAVPGLRELIVEELARREASEVKMSG